MEKFQTFGLLLVVVVMVLFFLAVLLKHAPQVGLFVLTIPIAAVFILIQAPGREASVHTSESTPMRPRRPSNVKTREMNRRNDM